MKNLVLFLSLFLVSVQTLAGIPVTSSFTMNAALPLDDRATVADLTARDALPALRRWEGMLVYVVSEQKHFTLKGGIADVNWSELSGSGAGLSTWITATPYVVDDIVVESNKIYKCLTNHTSGTFSVDFASNYWVELSDSNDKITGPASATDNAIVRYDSTTGKLAKNSGVTIDDSNNVSGVANLTATGTTTLSTSLNGVGKFVAGVLSASTILNTDIASNAAIDYSKLAPLSTGQVLLGNAGVPTATTLSGGATVGATGVVTLGNSAVITQLLTGYASSPGTVSSADSIVQAIQKIDGNGKLKLGLTKSDSDGSAVTTTQLNVPNSQLTTSGTNTRRIETGNDNLLKNPSFEATTVGSDWTAVNGSCAASSGVTIDGLKNCLFTSSGTNWSLSQCSTTNAPRLAGQEMENSVWLGSASTSDPIWVCPGTNGSYPTPSVANGCMQYTNIGNIQQVKNYFLGDSASTSNCIRISGSNSGTTVGIDKAYTGLRTTSEVSGELNTPWQSCGLTTADFQGFGTVSSIELQCKRSGPDLLMRGKFTPGTTTGVEARLSLKFNGQSLTSAGSSLIPSLQQAGDMLNAVSSTLFFRSAVLIEPSVGYVTFSAQTSTLNALTKRLGNDFASSTALSITARIPIAEWQNNINAFSTKCDDPRQCETVFSALISPTGTVSGENTDWLNGNCTTVTGTQNFLTTCNYNTGIFSVAPNCTASLKKEYNWTGGAQVVNSISASYTVSNAGSGAVGTDVYLTCYKTGEDYERSKITQQIVQMRDVPRTPGAVRTDIFAVSYGTTNATTVCSASPCSYLDQIGNNVTSITRSAVGQYVLNLRKTYTKLKCTSSLMLSTTSPSAGSDLNCSSSASCSFVTGISGIGSRSDAYGTLMCQGEY